MSKRLLLIVVAAVSRQVSPTRSIRSWTWWPTRSSRSTRSSSCEQLWQKKGKPKSPEEQRMIGLLQSDPQMRQAFINKVAAPDREQDVRMRDDPLMIRRRREAIMKNAIPSARADGRTLALVVGLLVAAGVAAQSSPPAAKPATHRPRRRSLRRSRRRRSSSWCSSRGRWTCSRRRARGSQRRSRCRSPPP